MRYLLIDCDPGHDDAMAILTACAHPEELKILGITTVGGNQTLKRVTENAKNILRFDEIGQIDYLCRHKIRKWEFSGAEPRNVSMC